jgi:hypothetical protein
MNSARLAWPLVFLWPTDAVAVWSILIGCRRAAPLFGLHGVYGVYLGLLVFLAQIPFVLRGYFSARNAHNHWWSKLYSRHMLFSCLYLILQLLIGAA